MKVQFVRSQSPDGRNPWYFEAVESFDYRADLKDNGWRWFPNRKIWWTTSVEKAAPFVQFVEDTSVHARLQQILNEQQSILDSSWATDSDINIPVPAGHELLAFQKAGIEYASKRNDCIIGDEMGLGKTVQALGVINTDDSLNSILIVCPANVKMVWLRHIQEWLTRPMTADVVVSSKPFPSQSQIVIVNYEIIGRYPEIINKRWDMMIVDEAQKLSNAAAQRTQTVVGGYDRDTKKELKGINAKRRLFLTGTPINNRPIEFFPILHAIDGKRFPNVISYGKRYCAGYQKSIRIKGGGVRKVWDFSGSSRSRELQILLRKEYMIRRLKNDVLTELPPKRRQIIEISQNGLHEFIEAQNVRTHQYKVRIEELKTALDAINATEDREGYEKASRELEEAIRVAFHEMSKVRHETGVAMVPHVIEHIEGCLESVDKLVVWAHHQDVIEAITDHFGETAVKLYGAENDLNKRQMAIDSFQNDPKVKVFVGAIMAAGTGLTLTAASHAVFAELDWVPGNVAQAEDRIHRKGQLDSVLIQHLVLEGTLAARIVEIIVEKQNVIDRILDNGARTLAVQTKEETQPADTKQPVFRAQNRVSKEQVLTEDQKQAIMSACLMLDGCCDGARDQDAVGFNGLDSGFGKSVAAFIRERGFISPKQALRLKKMLPKYHKQIGEALVARIRGEA